jgi:hypothetical protein
MLLWFQSTQQMLIWLFRDDAVGSPVVFVYYRGTRLSFKRGTEDVHPFISAQLTADRINRLVTAVRQTRSDDAGADACISIDF